MDLEIKKLVDKDYDQLTLLCSSFWSYLAEKFDTEYTPWTSEYTKYQIERNITDNGVLLGIFHQNKLIGTIGARYSEVIVENEQLKCGIITFYSLNPDKMPLSKDNKTKIFNGIVEEIRQANCDFALVVFDHNISSEEEKIFKSELNFVRMNKNVEYLTKLLGSEGVDVIKAKKELNVVLAQLAKLMAKMENVPLPGGNIRDATPEDYPKIIEFLNAYSKDITLTQIWTEKSFNHFIKVSTPINEYDYSELKNEFPNTQTGFFLKVWERNNEIIGTIAYRVMPARFKHGLAPLTYWDLVAFPQDLGSEDKKAFLVNIYNSLYKKTSTVTAFWPFYDLKTFKQTGFMSSQMTTPLYILALTNKGEKLIELKKLSKFYLLYMEFLC